MRKRNVVGKSPAPANPERAAAAKHRVAPSTCDCVSPLPVTFSGRRLVAAGPLCAVAFSSCCCTSTTPMKSNPKETTCKQLNRLSRIVVAKSAVQSVFVCPRICNQGAFRVIWRRPLCVVCCGVAWWCGVWWCVVEWWCGVVVWCVNYDVRCEVACGVMVWYVMCGVRCAACGVRYVGRARRASPQHHLITIFILLILHYPQLTTTLAALITTAPLQATTGLTPPQTRMTRTTITGQQLQQLAGDVRLQRGRRETVCCDEEQVLLKHVTQSWDREHEKAASAVPQLSTRADQVPSKLGGKQSE